jgi:1-pyrroline-5-carboxylate dehydrogenase
VAHPSADVDALAVAIVRGAFEYQGQKCSAASRVYVPESALAGARDAAERDRRIRMGDVTDFRNFMGAVIDRRRSTRSRRHRAGARRRDARDPGRRRRATTEGWFVEPTLIQVRDPRYRLMCEEIFGPVVTRLRLPGRDWEETLELVDRRRPTRSPARCSRTIAARSRAPTVLRHAAGNFYINDKPTGAVVGQQPFGGARASGRTTRRARS